MTDLSMKTLMMMMILIKKYMHLSLFCGQKKVAVCREMAVVERFKQESMYGLSTKKTGRCEMVISGGSTVS